MSGAIGLKLRKDAFFDREAVREAVGAVEAFNLSKGGSFVRQTARRSMRRRKKASAPGTPPSSHTAEQQVAAGSKRGRGPLLKDRLFYQFDSSTRSVVVGPELLGGSKTEAAETEEFGKTKTRTVKVYRRRQPSERKPRTAAQSAAFQRLKREGRLRDNVRRESRQFKYPARPFMRPALEKEMPRILGVWKDSVGGPRFSGAVFNG